MKTSDKAFEQILQELLKQKQYLDDMERENRELRSQLADLRAGRRILVDILGQQYSLVVDSPAAHATIQLSSITDQTPTSELPVTPAPENPAAETERQTDEMSPSSSPAPSPSFLEEMIFDQLASSATSSMAVWSGPAAQSPPRQEEEEKAALRRELMDSFLLE